LFKNPLLYSRGSVGGAAHFTLFIHLRIGPVTVLSAVSGDITSEIWL
jgi:hypothetical protein